MARIRRRRFTQLSAAALATGGACGGEPQPAGPPPLPEDGPDVIVTGGTVITMATKPKEAEAVAIRGGVVEALGGAAEIGALRGRHTEVVDLKGGFAMPGWVDAELDVEALGQELEHITIKTSVSDEDLPAVLAAAARGSGWIVATLQREIPTGEPVRRYAALHERWPERPVVLRYPGKAGVRWANAAALAAAGVLAADRDVERDPEALPTGLVRGDAAKRLTPGPPERADVRRWILAALAHVAPFGTARVHHVGMSAHGAAVYEGAVASPDIRLPVAVHGYYNWNAFAAVAGKKAPLTKATAPYNAAGAYAALDTQLPYGGRRTIPNTLDKRAREGLGNGWKIALRACDRKAVHRAVQALARAHQRYRNFGLRIHGAHRVGEDDLRHILDMGAFVAADPVTMWDHHRWFAERQQKLGAVMAWSQFLASGIPVVVGSGEGQGDLRRAAAAMLLRGAPDTDALPGAPFERSALLRGLTSDAWRSVATDGGTLVKGAPGDVTCFAIDPRVAPAKELASAPVLATIVGGHVAHRRSV